MYVGNNDAGCCEFLEYDGRIFIVRKMTFSLPENASASGYSIPCIEGELYPARIKMIDLPRQGVKT